MVKTILITGATSGFGEAIAHTFASNNWRCIITGRREDRLIKITKELMDKYNAEVYPLAFDVQQNESVKKAIHSLPEKWQNIDLLINNAGGAWGRDNFEKAEIEDWDKMIDTNVKGLLYVSKAVLPCMLSKKAGHIINIGSIAAKEVYENGNVYCAAKHAVDAISKSMRVDLLSSNIKITAIHPGAAETEFSIVRFKGDKEKANKVYEGYEPLLAKDIADMVYYCATLPAHVCINDLVVTCTAQANSFYLNRK